MIVGVVGIALLLFASLSDLLGDLFGDFFGNLGSLCSNACGNYLCAFAYCALNSICKKLSCFASSTAKSLSLELSVVCLALNGVRFLLCFLCSLTLYVSCSGGSLLTNLGLYVFYL